MTLTKEQRQNYLLAIPEAEREDLLNASDEDLQEYAELCVEQSKHRSEATEAREKATEAREKAAEAREKATEARAALNAIMAEEFGQDWMVRDDLALEGLLKNPDRERAKYLAKQLGIEKEFQAALSKPLLGHAQRVEEQRSRQSCCVML